MVEPVNLDPEVNNNSKSLKESPKKKNHPKKTFQYGNYPGYYSKRNGIDSLTSDKRLEMLENHKNLINGKRILDIGCNDGLFTLCLVKKFYPKSMLGVDIDGSLIGKPNLLFILVY